MSLSADDIPSAVQWHEGMMLAPQHFQVSDRRHEQLQSYHAERLQPYYWGVRSLDFDDMLIVEGLCRVLSLDAVLPDGTPVAHTAAEKRELEIDLSDHEDAAREAPVTIQAALPVRSAPEGEGSPDRYTSTDGDPVVDQTTGSRSIRIPRRVPHLRLLVTDTLPGQYVGFPVTTVRKTDEGFAFTDYAPPRLNVPLDSEIGALCRSLIQSLRKKARSLADRIQSPAVDPGSVQELDGKRKIQALVAGLPRLEAQLHGERIHPYTLYQSLCGIAGSMARLTRQMVPPSFSAYDHNDSRASYAEVISYILRALSEGVQETYAPIQFDTTDEGFALPFREEWQTTDLVLGIRGRPDQEEPDLRRWGKQCLIGAASRIDSMRERRVLGVDRTPIERADDLIPPKNTVLFRLDAQSDFIEPDEDLVVRRGEERGARERPLELVLYVKESETE